MVKTQVQIPDQLYQEGKRIAAEYEMSFADVVRRGLERIIPSFPPRGQTRRAWTLPKLDLGLLNDPFTDSDWRENLNVEAPSSKRSKSRRSR